MPRGKSDGTLTLLFSHEFKKLFQDAAAQSGMSLRDFAMASLIEASQKILLQHQVTRLSRRDWQRFARALDDTSTRPNRALIKAAQRYRSQVRDA